MNMGNNYLVRRKILNFHQINMVQTLKKRSNSWWSDTMTEMEILLSTYGKISELDLSLVKNINNWWSVTADEIELLIIKSIRKCECDFKLIKKIETSFSFLFKTILFKSRNNIIKHCAKRYFIYITTAKRIAT